MTVPATDLSEVELLQVACRLALDYLQTPTSPPFPSAAAIELARAAWQPLSPCGAAADQALRELAQTYGPATVRSHSGRYFGFVHGSSLPVAMAAKWLSTVWDQNTPLYALSPAAALLEAQTEAWLVDLLGLPEETAVGFVSSSSQSILTGLFVARQTLLRRSGWEVRQRGLDGAPRLRVVVGEQAHVAVHRALAILGIGLETLEVVPADDQGRIEVSRLPVLDGRTILVLQAGNIYTGACDRFAEIVPVAHRAGAWVHVDGAFGLWAAASPTHAKLVGGVEAADSWSADCHKTLNTPFSCGLVLCRDRAALRDALSATGTYLAAGCERNGMEYSPDMARRCMVAEVWATLRTLGRSGVASLVEGLCARARELAVGLCEAGYVVLNDVVFNQVCARLRTDDATRRVLRRLQEGGDVWCGGGVWQGRQVIRLSVSSWRTTAADVAVTLDAFRRAASGRRARSGRG